MEVKMQSTARPLSPLILDDGTFHFFSYPKSRSHWPLTPLITADTALNALMHLLRMFETEMTFSNLIFTFSSQYYYPKLIVDEFGGDDPDIEKVAFALLDDLYHRKYIDPHSYYRWDFMSNGLSKFVFRGANEADVIQSFILNYRKALSPQANRHANPKELKQELEMAFRTLFGMKGLTLGELLIYQFVSPVHIRDLKEASVHTVNKYKRAA
jgi:hypothetical protein